MSGKKLKACPFCGTMNISIAFCGGLYRVKCDSCDGSGAMVLTEFQAVENWNRRAKKGRGK
jgi:transcription elongation factor Elf1